MGRGRVVVSPGQVVGRGPGPASYRVRSWRPDPMRFGYTVIHERIGVWSGPVLAYMACLFGSFCYNLFYSIGRLCIWSSFFSLLCRARLGVFGSQKA